MRMYGGGIVIWRSNTMYEWHFYTASLNICRFLDCLLIGSYKTVVIFEGVDLSVVGEGLSNLQLFIAWWAEK